MKKMGGNSYSEIKQGLFNVAGLLDGLQKVINECKDSKEFNQKIDNSIKALK